MCECDVYVSIELGLIKWHISETLCVQVNHYQRSPEVTIVYIIEESPYTYIL